MGMKTTWSIIAGLIFIFILTCAPLQAVPTWTGEYQPAHDNDSTPLFLFAKDGKFGFVDKTGKVAIEPQFELADPFSEGFAAVLIGDKWGFIDKTGKVVISPQFDATNFFSDGLALVLIGWKQVYIDKTGKVVIDGGFDQAHSFSEGLAAVVIDDGGTDRWAYIDTKGDIAINTHSDTASCFSEGLAVIGTQDETGSLEYIDRPGGASGSGSKGPIGSIAVTTHECKLGYIDKTGKVVIEQQFDYASPFSEGLAAVRVGSSTDGRFGFIDKTGNMVITPQFEFAESFSDGMAAIRMGKKWGYIGSKGNMVIEPQLYSGGSFSDGFAEVKIDSWEWGRYVIIDKKGESVSTPDIGPSSEDLYRFILFTVPRSIAGFLIDVLGNTTNSQP